MDAVREINDRMSECYQKLIYCRICGENSNEETSGEKLQRMVDSVSKIIVQFELFKQTFDK